MLILTRKPGESIYIGDHVKVTVVEIKGNQIRVGIDAPTELRIYREEIYLQILEENRRAAQGVSLESASLDSLSAAFQSGMGGDGGSGDAKKGLATQGMASALKPFMASTESGGKPRPAGLTKAAPGVGQPQGERKLQDPEVVVRRKRSKRDDE